jgi:hypothetical protein
MLMMKFKERERNQLGKGEKKTWVNLSNPISKLWDYDNFIKSKLKNIMKFNPQ